jgi:hypothetical protein
MSKIPNTANKKEKENFLKNKRERNDSKVKHENKKLDLSIKIESLFKSAEAFYYEYVRLIFLKCRVQNII